MKGGNRGGLQLRKMRTAGCIKLTAGVITAAAVYAAGAGIMPITYSPFIPEKASAASEKTLATVEAKLIETHTVEYVEETVVETKYLNVIREVPVELQDFGSLQELETWLKAQMEICVVRFGSPEKVVDCDDYAIEMQKRALADGYLISLQVIDTGMYNRMFVGKIPESHNLHAVNLAVIGNDVFFFEPQNGEIARVAHLD